MTNDISATLQERGKRYGSFDGHAQVTQELKFIINKGLYERQKTITPSMKEALDMIAHKIGRIINGDPFYADSWIDIAGYAQLVADELDDEVDEVLDGLAAARAAELDADLARLELAAESELALQFPELDALVADEFATDVLIAEVVSDTAIQEPNESHAQLPAIEEEVNDSHPQFGPVTEEHREWAQEILDGLAGQRQGEL